MSTSIPTSTLEKFSTFGDLLRFLRRRAGFTQMELSIAVGYSDAQISRLEQNLRLPDLPTIEARFVPALNLEHEPEVVSRLMDLAANVRREDGPGLGLCPYKGLNYFDETDVDLFVGRESLTAKLAEQVVAMSAPGAEQERFLAIIGASGSGKSSLLRAGLVPAVRWHKQSANWPICVFTPTAHPLESMAASLTQDAGSMVATATLMDDLLRDPRSLNLYAKAALKPTGADRFLLVIDQFEELFTLARSESERCAFIENLLTAAGAPDGPVMVVIAMRADFYAYCAGYPKLREALSHQQEYIGTMGDEELRRAIEEPAYRARWEFEPGLIDLLLRDVGHEPGALPLLSHALLETWQRRRGRIMTMSGYAASGGVRGAIAETAEAVFTDKFTADQQSTARRIFTRLTELGDETSTGDTRRRAVSSELILRPEDEAITTNVLNTLADARLITTDNDSVEVAHEALIREWPRLRGWLEENREGLRLQRHLTETAREWAALNREPDGLYRGARLVQTREWAAAHAREMNVLEQEFLDASLAWAEREAAERELQQQRELQTAHKLAELERQRAEENAASARQLGRRAVYLTGAFGIAILMALTALFFGARARQAAVAAQEQQRVSISRELAAASITNLVADPERSILLAMQAVAATYTIDKTWTAEAENALRSALQNSRVLLTLRGHTDRVWAVAFGPPCESAAGGTAQPCVSRLATASDDGTLIIWDASTGQGLLTLSTEATRGFHGMAFSPDGSLLVSASAVGTASVWNAVTGQRLVTLRGHTNWVHSVAFTRDGKRIATASADRTVIIWDPVTGQALLTLNGHTNEVWDVAFSPDGKRIATASLDGRVKVWDAATGTELRTLTEERTLPFYSVAFSPDGARLAASSDDRLVKIWDAATGADLITLRGHTDIVWKVTFSPDGTRLASASMDGKAKVWETETGQELLTLAGHTGPVVDLAFRPDCGSALPVPIRECGSMLATASLDGTAKVWNTAFSQELLTVGETDASFAALSFGQTHLATGARDGTVRIADISAGLQPGHSEPSQAAAAKIIQTFSENGKQFWEAAFSPDGTLLAAASDDQMVRVWDLKTGTLRQTFQSHTGQIYPLLFSPDGSRLAAANDDYTIRVWDSTSAETKTPLTIITPGWSVAIAYHPDGTQLAAGLFDGTAMVWDAETGTDLLTLRRHTGEIWGIAYSPDGTRLATASEDGSAKVWDAKTGAEQLSLRGHSGAVNAVTFNPDGTRIATAGQDGTVKLWDAATGLELKTLYGHTDALSGVAFSPDGFLLSSTSENGIIRFYLLEIEDLMALARTRVTRTINALECQQYLHLSVEQCQQDHEPAAASLLTAPNPTGPQTLTGQGRVCVMTDEYGVNDQFFNQIAYQGVLKSVEMFGWQDVLLEPIHPDDYLKNINQLLGSNCDLIVTPTGVFFNDLIRGVADVNPQQKFQVLDFSFDPPLENLWAQLYAIDQASFLAGYVAAGVTKTGRVGTYGGIHIPAITDFMDGFALGVAHYNKMNGTDVEVIGWDIRKREGYFTGNFIYTEDSRKMGARLMDEGADIILPVVGGVGLGTAAEALDRGGVYIIGVDSDWVVTYPEYADIILTSIEKRMDTSVVWAVESIVNGTFIGGTHPGTLENGGVGIAPFHNLESLVSPELKAGLEQVRTGIIAGDIKTKP